MGRHILYNTAKVLFILSVLAISACIFLFFSPGEPFNTFIEILQAGW